MRIWLVIASVLGALGVILGAIGAHALKDVTPLAHSFFSTANAFHMYHALAIGLAALAMRPSNRAWALLSCQLFLTGIVLFSFSLYEYALNPLHVLIFMPPLGGLCFIGGWGSLAVAAWKLETP